MTTKKNGKLERTVRKIKHVKERKASRNNVKARIKKAYVEY
jgi:hypothetical protein